MGLGPSLRQLLDIPAPRSLTSWHSFRSQTRENRADMAKMAGLLLPCSPAFYLFFRKAGRCSRARIGGSKREDRSPQSGGRIIFAATVSEENNQGYRTRKCVQAVRQNLRHRSYRCTGIVSVSQASIRFQRSRTLARAEIVWNSPW
jgi:hypothetical protein